MGSNERAPEHSLSEKDFRFICKLVYDGTGIVLNERKQDMVYRRLMRRTRDLKLASFNEYCRLLQDDNNDEFPNFVNAITTNLTSFFREEHHFDYLCEKFIPQHLSQYKHTHKLRIWSAACSTGEEPYSLAMTLIKTAPALIKSWDMKILATDLDTDVLSTARSGVYKSERIKDLSKVDRNKWFVNGSGANNGKVKVSDELKSLITFKQLNLLDEWPMRGPFDVILCRNVLIYFDRPTQAKLIQRYHQMLRPGGVLMLGHSESLPKDNTQFATLGRTIFAKHSTSTEQPYAQG